MMTEWLFPVSFGVGDRDGSLLLLLSCVTFLTGNCRGSPADWCLWELAVVLPESTGVVWIPALRNLEPVKVCLHFQMISL